MALSAENRHPIRLIERQWAGSHLGIEEAWRDDIDSGKLAPLSSQGLAEMCNKSFSAIVDRLIDRDIDNVCAHTRGYDENTVALALEDFADILGAVYDAVD